MRDQSKSENSLSLLERRVLVLVGGYGSGKTHLAISVALQRARKGQRVALVDLDLINPYFRSREMSEPLEREGVEVIRPEGDLAFAENPSLPPRIEGVLRDKSLSVVMDVGGNETGATVVGRYHELLNDEDIAVLQVVNVFRPFSATVREIEQLRQDIELRSHLHVQGWINNSNLKEWTTREYWQQSQSLMDELMDQSDLPLISCGMRPDLAHRFGMTADNHWIPVEPYLDLGWKKRV